jgi:hypothetical protein
MEIIPTDMENEYIKKCDRVEYEEGTKTIKCHGEGHQTAQYELHLVLK